MKKLATAIKTAEVKAAIHRKPFLVSKEDGCFYVQALSSFPLRRQAEIVLSCIFKSDPGVYIVRPKWKPGCGALPVCLETSVCYLLHSNIFSLFQLVGRRQGSPVNRAYMSLSPSPVTATKRSFIPRVEKTLKRHNKNASKLYIQQTCLNFRTNTKTGQAHSDIRSAAIVTPGIPMNVIILDLAPAARTPTRLSIKSMIRAWSLPGDGRSARPMYWITLPENLGTKKKLNYRLSFLYP